MGGDGHEWVLDTGIRKDIFGNARRGNLLRHDDAPLASPFWITAMRTRLILPLGDVFHDAKRKAGTHGTTRPLCGCPLCATRSAIYIDYYGFHLSSVVTTYTRRHHAFNNKVKSLANKAGWTVILENSSFKTSPDFNERDRAKRVDAMMRVNGLSRDTIAHIDPDALIGYTPSDLPPHLLLDYTFHHPGVYLKNLHKEDYADAGTNIGNRAALIKVTKYRALAQKISMDQPHLPQKVFLPMVLSVYGRQHTITRRLLRTIAHEAATAHATTPPPSSSPSSPYHIAIDNIINASAGLDPHLSPPTTDHSLNARIAHHMRVSMCSLSTLVISHLVEGMFECARHACHPPHPHRPSVPLTRIESSTHIGDLSPSPVSPSSSSSSPSLSSSVASPHLPIPLTVNIVSSMINFNL